MKQYVNNQENMKVDSKTVNCNWSCYVRNCKVPYPLQTRKLNLQKIYMILIKSEIAIATRKNKKIRLFQATAVQIIKQWKPNFGKTTKNVMKPYSITAKNKKEKKFYKHL